jgi:hypothetical protein
MQKSIIFGLLLFTLQTQAYEPDGIISGNTIRASCTTVRGSDKRTSRQPVIIQIERDRTKIITEITVNSRNPNGMSTSRVRRIAFAEAGPLLNVTDEGSSCLHASQGSRGLIRISSNNLTAQYSNAGNSANGSLRNDFEEISCDLSREDWQALSQRHRQLFGTNSLPLNGSCRQNLRMIQPMSTPSGQPAQGRTRTST